ncbi:MAG: hypothetical protein QOD96_4392, partial [Pseudonocardiales bacterium]|nr:hypothetical protein [Pseudonocardiales bacterium]
MTENSTASSTASNAAPSNAATQPARLRARELRLGYGDAVVIDDLDLDVL